MNCTSVNGNVHKNQTTNVINVLKLLRDRELGYVNWSKSNKFTLNNYGYNLTDSKLVNKLENFYKPPEYRSVSGFEEELGSIYSLDFSPNGAIAAVSDTKRSVNFINLHGMRKIGNIKNFERTAWTMAFHPIDSGIIAIGCFGGQVNVYKNLDLYRTATDAEGTTPSPISSLAFHPLKFYILFAHKNSLTVWDWEHDIKLYKYESSPRLYVRYVKSVPFSNKLVTGIEFPSLKLSELNKLPSEMENTSDKLSFLLNLLSNFVFDLEASRENEVPSVMKRKFDSLTKLLAIFIDSYKAGKPFGHDFSKSNLLEVNKSLDIINNRVKFIVRSSKYYEGFDCADLFNPMYRTELNNIQLRCSTRVRLTVLYDIMNYLNQFIKLFEDKIDEERNPWQTSEINRIVMANNNYVLQLWDFDDTDNKPDLVQNWRNTITSSYILNDSTLAISCCGKMICSFTEVLSPNNFKTTIKIHSLVYSTLGDCLFTYDLNCLKTLSLSFSTSTNFLMIGVRSEHIFAYILNMHTRKIKVVHKNKKCDINCIKWAPRPNGGILIGFQDNLQLRYL